MTVNWDAMSAIGTIGATLVALFLPFLMAKREWDRRDRDRQTELDRHQKVLSGVQQEVCSAVDRVLAYQEAAIALFDSKPVYLVGIEAIRRVRLNTKILLEILAIYENRSQLTDGALYSVVSAKRVAEAIVEETEKVIGAWGHSDPNWTERKARLCESNELAHMARNRVDGVRSHWKLAESSAAAEIRNKYISLVDAIRAAAAADSGAPNVDLSVSYY